MRYPISFEPWYALLSHVALLSPSQSFLEIGEEVRVRMGWAFDARFPRTAVASVEPWDGFTLSRGVHGFAGRWLVNGAGSGILAVHLKPEQRARVMGVPVRLRELLVSVEDPAEVRSALVPSPPRKHRKARH